MERARSAIDRRRRDRAYPVPDDFGPKGFIIDASVLSLILRHGVPLVALLICAGEIGVPTGIPAEVALMLAGAYAVHSVPQLIGAVALVSLADLTGTTTLHLVARTGGVRLLDRFVSNHGGGRAGLMAKWRRRLGDRDVLVVFVVRLLPLVRMYIAIGAGLMRIRLRNFILGAAPAAVIWAGSPVVLGYLFRSRVQSFATHYTRATHLILILLPLVGLFSLMLWWIRRGPSLRSRLHRGRYLLGFAAALVAVGYVVRTAWITEKASDHGRILLPYPLLVFWLALLGGLALALLGVAIDDVRQAHHAKPTPLRPARPLAAEIATTLLWVLLVASVGAAVIVIELRYPAI
jgi:alkaline phosphatase